MKREKRYYRFAEDSAPGKRMSELMERVEEVHRVADDFADLNGATTYIESMVGLAGGVDALIVPVTSPLLTSVAWKYFHVDGLDDDSVSVMPDVSFKQTERILRDIKDRKEVNAFRGMKILRSIPARIRLWFRDKVSRYTPAMEIERMRMELPVVSVLELLAILRPEPSGGKAKAMVMRETPSFFQRNGYWYFEMPFACVAEGMEPIEEKTFFRQRLAAINEEP